MPLDDDHVEALIADLEAALNENALLRRQVPGLVADVQRLREQVAYLNEIRAPLEDEQPVSRPRRWWWWW